MLHEQPIGSNVLGNRVFRGTKGGGVSLKHPSVVADAVLWALSEPDCGTDVNIQRGPRVSYFFRFRDDLFMAAHDSRLAKQFCSACLSLSCLVNPWERWWFAFKVCDRIHRAPRPRLCSAPCCVFVQLALLHVLFLRDHG